MLLTAPCISWNYSPIDPRITKQIKRTVPLRYAGPIDQVSNNICRKLAASASIDSQLRCTSLLSQSIRSLRMRYVKDSFLWIPRLQIYEHYDRHIDFQQDGYVFMMTYVYDDDSMMHRATFTQSHLDWIGAVMHDNTTATADVIPNCPLETTEIPHQSSHDNEESVVQVPSPSLLLIRPHVCIFGPFSSHLATLTYLMRYHVHWIFPSIEDEEEFRPGALQNLTDKWMNEMGLQFTFASITGYYLLLIYRQLILLHILSPLM